MLLAAAVVCASLLLYFTLTQDTQALSDSPKATVAHRSEGKTNGTGRGDTVLLSVPYLSQEEVLPSGCEAVSAVMLLRYYGLDVNVYEWIDRCLPCSGFWYEEGQLVNVSPAEAFIGSPYETTGLGCYAPVITRALNDWLKEAKEPVQALDTTGTSLEELCSRYIDRGTPALVWASIRMQPFKQGMQWRLNGREEQFTWLSPEHCLVLVGYDEDSYYFNDPYESAGTVSYEKTLVNERFERIGMQSVVLEES